MRYFPRILFILGVALLLCTGGVQALHFGLAHATGPIVREGAAPVSGIGFSDAMRALITVAAVAASLFVILAKRYSSADKHWAYATIGTILGFWLPK